ncbi:MAG: bifunctional riboflavin kinase/FAD synthetase [Paludibacteraceae bacterium]|nr:bifunctional riboflavin kinase/FAD synthetase [Paludibacteraceae bacterium]
MSYTATIGFFDGVHVGHRFVLRSMLEVASQRGMQSAVITFTQHPQAVLTNKQVPLLTTTDERIKLLREQGIDEIFAFNFPVIKDLTAAEFIHILHNQCDVRCLLMGYDHHFGSDRLRSFEDYARLAAAEGVEIMKLPALCAEPTIGGRQPSSSAIRKALLQSDITSANTMLGYSYTLKGEVVHGKGIGRTLGFPTANIAVPQEKLLPAAGVYACTISCHKSSFNAILNIGNNPTVGGTGTTVEVHIPDFNSDLYGDTVTVEIKRFIRAEQHFSNTEELKQQIKADIKNLTDIKHL